MAKSGNGKNNEKNEKRNGSGLKTQTKHGIIAIVFFVLALFFLMAMPWFNMAGLVGKNAYELLDLLFGYGYIMLPTLFILLGVSFMKSEVPEIGWTRITSGIFFLLSS